MNIDEWAVDGPRISPELLSRLRKIIEDESSLIVEHRFYRAARAPHRFVCDDFGELERYLRESASTGDALWFWSFETCCREDNPVAQGKLPDEQGRVPLKGAY